MPSTTSPSSPSDAAWPGERQGRASGATLWALFFADPSALHTSTEIKIVWRMTGSGDLSISATGPGGRTISPAWGPTAHGGSSWYRPGQEWGTGWVFPVPGRWVFHAARTGGGAGELTVHVA